MDAGHAVWAGEEFGRAMLGDVRLVVRLQAMAAGLASRPAASVAEAYAADRAVGAAYDFLEHSDVDWRDLAAASHGACARRCSSESLVVVAIDGTSWTFTDVGRKHGTGPIGSRAQGARGIKAMTAYAMTSQGIPCGVLAQALWARSDEPNPVAHALRPLHEKESRWWTELQAQCEAQFLGRSSLPRLWYQMDREADQVPVLLRATAPGVLVTVRANDNRVLSAQSIDGGHRALKLADVLDHAPDAGEHSIKIARNRTRKARTARLSVRFASVSLRLREQWSHSFVADAPVTVVHVREIDPPAGGEPIEWVLYTTYPVTTLEDALSVVRTYALRWRIERMHYTTKTGAGCLHDSQLRSFGALAKWITLHVAVASRLQSILYRAREEPDTPADQEFSRDEIEATLLLRESHYGKSYPSGRTPSLGELVFFIAKLGGYMGSATSKSPPGIKIFERAFLRVEAAAHVVAALRARDIPPSAKDGSTV